MNAYSWLQPYCPFFMALALGVAPLAGCTEKQGATTGTPTTTTESTAHAHDDTTPHSHAEDPASTASTLKLELASQPTAIEPGTPATWTMRVLDAKSGQAVTDFEMSHEKLLHLIVVANDMSWFNHLHPEYKDGAFTVTTTLPKEGSYHIYADVMPKGGKQQAVRYELATGGAQPTPTQVMLVNDTANADGWMMRTVAAKPESEPDAPGGESYQVALMPMPTKLTAGKDAMLHFQVRDANGKPVKDLEPYLGALGHAVILSSDGSQYLHAHPTDGSAAGHEGMNHGTTGGGHAHAAPSSGGPDVIFHTNFPRPGQYKAWGQFKHNGKIITAAYVIVVG